MSATWQKKNSSDVRVYCIIKNEIWWFRPCSLHDQRMIFVVQGRIAIRENVVFKLIRPIGIMAIASRHFSIHPEIAYHIADEAHALWIVRKNQVNVYRGPCIRCNVLKILLLQLGKRTMKSQLCGYIPQRWVVCRPSPCAVHRQGAIRYNGAIAALPSVLPCERAPIRKLTGWTIVHLDPSQLIAERIIDGVIYELSCEDDG